MVRWAIMCVVVLALHASNAAAFTILNMAGPFACSRASATARLAAHRQIAVCLHMMGDDTSGMQEPGNEPIVPPVPPKEEIRIQNLLPADVNFDNVHEFVRELVVDPAASGMNPRSATVGKDGVVNIPVDENAAPTTLGPVIQPKMSMIFTCCRCETRQMRSFTRLAYEKGIVIVQCKGCGVRHLIADNLGWYYDWLEKGDTNVQDIMARKGVTVPRLQGEEALSLWQEWNEENQ